MLLRGKVSSLAQQYGRGLGQPVRLRASDEQLQSVADAALFNVLVSSSETPRKLIVVGGPPGVGKTRLGYEALAMAVDQSGPLFNQLQDVTGSPLLVVPVYINFSNGFTVQRLIDLTIGVSTSNRLGARVAAAVLSMSLGDVNRLAGGLQGLAVDDVLDAILLGVVAERRARRIAGVSAEEDEGLQREPIVLFAVHMDEYQLFSMELAGESGWNKQSAATEVRRMLSLINNYVIKAGDRADLPARVALLPVATGTPYDGVHILWTKMLTPQLLLPADLSLPDAEGLFTDHLTRSAPFVGHARLVRGAVDCLAAKVTMLDVDLRPRFVVQLADQLVSLTPRDASAQDALRAVHWHDLATAVTSSIIQPITPDAGKLLTRLSLFRIPIKFVFLEGDALSYFERVVRLAEAVGHLRLGRLPASSNVDEYRTVSLPFLQLRRWGLDKMLPPRLMAVPVRPWSADDFEDLVAHYLCERINFFATYFEQPVPLAFVLPGALGSRAVNSVCVSLHGRRSVYREQFQWLHAKTDQPAKMMTVSAVNEDLTLRPPPEVVRVQAAPAKDKKHEQEIFVMQEGVDDGPDTEPGDSENDQQSVPLAEDVFEAELRRPAAPEDAAGAINLKVQKQQFEACDLSTGVFKACRNNALLDVRLSLPLAAQRRSCVTTDELNYALAVDARTATARVQRDLVSPAVESSPGPHLHIYLQIKQTNAGVAATQDGISTWYQEARAATIKWRTGGDHTLFVFFTNRHLSALPDSFFTERADLLVVSRDQLSEALSPVLVRRALVAQL